MDPIKKGPNEEQSDYEERIQNMFKIQDEEIGELKQENEKLKQELFQKLQFNKSTGSGQETKKPINSYVEMRGLFGIDEK
ncbi:hypothetical protein SeMB42_g06077 [Synchytrium endobioticum]|uniref:Uncharacterized protein n=1 Tax=Synchytrium endobioticum TaxID=286115 RepID=A0A507BY02_9FUNG|nr:hypothetical protein SeLEV6574_g08495 [Synchytrium endobioticum]TPX40219.1 hypothetical protein SeMB42_g06077 [Synchytrium endobioticum]